MTKAQSARLARPVACGLQRFESESLCALARQPPYQVWRRLPLGCCGDAPHRGV